MNYNSNHAWKFPILYTICGMKTAIRWHVHTADGTRTNNSQAVLTMSLFTADKKPFHVTSLHTSPHIAICILNMHFKTGTDPSPLGKQLLTFAFVLEWCKNCLAFQNCSIRIQSQQCTRVGQWIQFLHTTFLLSAKYFSVILAHIHF
jgi:hypothetical protein